MLGVMSDASADAFAAAGLRVTDQVTVTGPDGEPVQRTAVCI